jgi:hypothetical protein
MARIERGDDDEKSWDGRKLTISSLTIWIIDADATQSCVYISVDQIVPTQNMFGHP